MALAPSPAEGRPSTRRRVPPRVPPERWARIGVLLETPWVIVLGLLALTAIAGAVRVRALSAPFWLDEVQAVNISARPLGDIPHLLRVDGSPPLYYVVLHVWTSVFGPHETWSHLLSAGFAALCVPVGWIAARLALDARAAWIAALLLATNPFLGAYANQARMYTLLALLSLVVVAAFLAAYVHRRRAFIPVFGVTLALALYTHNWAFFLAAGCTVAMLACWRARGRDRRLLVDGALGLGLAALLYLPWVPELLDQVRHTGAPWSVHPTVRATTRALQQLVGGEGPSALLLVVGGAGVVALLRRRRAAGDELGIAAVLVASLATLVVALLFCRVSLAWAPRYLAVLVGPLIVLGAAGLSSMRGVGIAATVLALLMTFQQPRFADLANKTNIVRLAHSPVGQRLEPGDLAISTQPEQLPALVRYLPAGLRYANPMGLATDPQVMDWRDAKARLEASSAAKDLVPLVDRLPVGHHVLLVNPYTDPQGLRGGWARLVRARKVAWSQTLRDDPRLRRIGSYRGDTKARLSAASGQLFVKVRR